MTNTTNFDSSLSSLPLLDALRRMPWVAVLLLSCGIATWLLLQHVNSAQFMPTLDVGTWLGLACATRAGCGWH